METKMSLSSQSWRRWLIFVLPLVFLAIMLTIKLESGGSGRGALYENLNYEDHLIQNLQFAFLASATILFVFAAVRFKAQPRYMRWVVLLAALVVFFFAGEEIGWGQEIWHFQIGQFFTANSTEGRSTIHNLREVDPTQDYIYMLEGLVGGLAWLLPAALAKRIPLRKWFIPPWYLTLYFLPLALNGFLWQVKTGTAFFSSAFAAWRPFLSTYMCYCDQEPAEFLFYLALLVLAIRLVLRGRKGAEGASA
jgi:hypothetical protein